MPDLTAGTQLASNTSGFAVSDLESGKFVVSSGGLVSVRSTVTSGTVTANGSHTSLLGTITVGSGKSSGTLASTISGLVRGITQVIPDLTGTGTATTRLVDSSTGTVIQLAAQDESTTIYYGTVQPINTSMSFISDTSGTGQASAMAIQVRIHYDL